MTKAKGKKSYKEKINAKGQKIKPVSDQLWARNSPVRVGMQPKAISTGIKIISTRVPNQ
jgi:hypothetical protein